MDAGSPSIANLFNAQPYIDTLKTGMVPHPRFTSDRFTFMLPHKHFDLRDGEILWIERRLNGYSVRVVQSSELEDDALPCMWIFSDGWRPFAYTLREFGCDVIPDIQPGDYNVGTKWLNSGGLETTDEDNMISIVTDGIDTSGRVIVTMINWEGRQTD